MPTPTRNILILAHPGHELRIHHWLELHRPTVYLLTDGSGGKLSSRTHYSRAVIENAGGLPGAVFGTITDKAWYSAILGGQSALFTTMLNAILDDIPLDRPVEIISDALDGYNPMHDMAWAFGKMVQHRLVASAISARHLCSAATTNVTGKTEVVLQLDSAARSRKIAAVEKYTPLAEEAQRIFWPATRPLSIRKHFFRKILIGRMTIRRIGKLSDKAASKAAFTPSASPMTDISVRSGSGCSLKPVPVHPLLWANSSNSRRK
ncbi:hypothetical protein HED55_00175 [Ochrobactrum haematophilum]|uniref:Uncharacterized protein n=1 Tax=Brucella haematophila TaxID=419474 RepID=A0ABX1DM32_9HYPH|nr:hypothetical protein [Brucella haematophila]